MIFVDKKSYLELLRQFINKEISVSEFDNRYYNLWSQDRAGEDELIKSWPERYDLQLDKLFFEEKKISKEEYYFQWNKLWGYETKAKKDFEEIIGSIFVSLDSYCDDPKLQDEDDIGEEQLRKEVQEKYDRLIKIPIDG